MVALPLVWSLYFVLRLTHEPPLLAFLASLTLVPLMLVALKLGGWTSFRSALGWAKNHKLVSALELIMVVAVLFGGIVGAMHGVLFSIAEAIAAYFFLHAFGAVGEWLLPRLAARLKR